MPHSVEHCTRLRPTVRCGGTLRAAVGVLAIESVEPVVDAEIAPSDAMAAGCADVDALRAELNKRTHGSLFRIRLRLRGPDPRAALRVRAGMTPQELETLCARLDTLDRRSRHGRWTFENLQAIDRMPLCRAADLAVRLSLDQAWLKAGIHKLKNLGLVESLDVGYRLSPRAQALLTHTACAGAHGPQGPPRPMPRRSQPA